MAVATAKLKLKGKKLFVGNMHVATVTGDRWRDKDGAPHHSFGLSLPDGRHKKLQGYSYFRDVVRDAPILMELASRME